MPLTATTGPTGSRVESRALPSFWAGPLLWGVDYSRYAKEPNRQILDPGLGTRNLLEWTLHANGNRSEEGGNGAHAQSSRFLIFNEGRSRAQESTL